MRRLKSGYYADKARIEKAGGYGDGGGLPSITPDGRVYTSRGIDPKHAAWLPRTVRLGDRLGLPVHLVGFSRETGRAIIRTERVVPGQNRLNSSRYRRHISHCESIATAALARAIDRVQAELGGTNGGQTPGAAGGIDDFLLRLTEAVEADQIESRRNVSGSTGQFLKQPTPAIPAIPAIPASGSDASSNTGATGGKAGQGIIQPSVNPYPVQNEPGFLTEVANKVIKRRWPVTPELLEGVVSGATHLLTTELQRAAHGQQPNPKTLLGACKLLAMLERQNQVDELKSIPTKPQLHLHAHQTQDAERTLTTADAGATLLKAVFAELGKRDLLERVAAAERPDTVDAGATGGDLPSGGDSGAGADDAGGVAGG